MRPRSFHSESLATFGVWVVLVCLSITAANAQDYLQNPTAITAEAEIAEDDSLALIMPLADLAALYQEARQYENEGKLQKAMAAYEKLLQLASDYGDANIKLQHLRQQLQQHENLQIEYAAGMAAFKLRHWTRAILAFERILQVDRGFRDVRKKLAQAEKFLKRERTASILSRYYNDAIAAMNRNDWGLAKAALEKIQKIDSSYQDVPSLSAKLENLQLQQTNAVAVISVATTLLDSLYRDGLNSLEKGDWTNAAISFEKLRLLQPNHPEVAYHLARVWEKLGKFKSTELQKESNDKNREGLYAGSAFAAFLALSVVVFASAARVRFHQWRGNHQRAAQMYEKILARNPHRVKLYSRLADSYLHLGRKDERAMKAYKAILYFNLATRRREEINKVVAQNYLTEGRTDADAIGVLEDALKTERRKLSQTNIKRLSQAK